MSVSVTLEALDWEHLLEITPWGGGVQDTRIHDAIAAAIPPPPPPPSSSIVIALTSDSTGVVVQATPTGTASVKFAVMASPTSPTSTIKYITAPYPLSQPYVPPAGYPVVDAIALDKAGSSIGKWGVEVTGKRLVTVPVAPPPPPSGGLQTGIVTNADNTFMDLHPKHNRSEYGMGTTAMGAKGAAENAHLKGSLLQPLVSMSATSIPSGVATAVKAWIGSGVKLVELGNELNYANKSGASRSAGENYGRIVKASAEALTPAGIGVLAIGEDGGTGSNAFLEGMLAAVPNLVDLIAKGGGGLTIHPYWGTGTYGHNKMDRMVAFWAAHGGANLPIYATEWGIPSDDGATLSPDPGQHASYQEAGEVIAKDPKILQEHAKGKMAQLLLYQTHDNKAPHATNDREAYFGARRLDGSRKGAMSTAADAFLAASA